MAQCEVCGNDYDKAISVMVSGEDSHTFDSFECAIHALAPICEYCNVKVIGHGVETDDSFYCCPTARAWQARKASRTEPEV
jgi:hypothetical protein